MAKLSAPLCGIFRQVLRCAIGRDSSPRKGKQTSVWHKNSTTRGDKMSPQD